MFIFFFLYGIRYGLGYYGWCILFFLFLKWCYVFVGEGYVLKIGMLNIFIVVMYIDGLYYCM